MINIRIGGVPEHFNLPWHLAMEEGRFTEKNIKVEWTDFYGGTGAMTKALRANEVDVAIVLTEGIVADIIKGNPAKIIGQYIKTPLVWGIHTGKASQFNDANELKGQRYSISRFGSGSHIMTFVDANNRGWNPAEQQFVKVGNLDGAIKAMNGGEADALLWEKFTTKPYVDNGTLKRIGETVTPWPCFVIVARNEFLEQHPNEIKDLLAVIHRRNGESMYNHDAPTVFPALVAERYEQKLEDVQEWYGMTRWATNNLVPKTVLKNVMETLKDVGVIEDIVAPEELCDTSIISFNKPMFKYADPVEQDEFYTKTVPNLLNQLGVNDLPRWGLMTSQHMIEHLGSVLLYSLKGGSPEPSNPSEATAVKSYLMSNKNFPKRAVVPGTKGKLTPLRFDSLETAKSKLLEVLDKSLGILNTQQDHSVVHPVGGKFSAAEWKTFHYKHIVHHFRQFGLIE